jgi:hypothetical protein
MGLNARELLDFPAGDNSSDTLIGSIHWNLTTLQHWNYTYYSNGTFSNGSRCYLLFEPYTPRLLQNGTFLNSTSCYSPISPMGTRSIIGVIYACIFSLSIMFTFINLRKHGKLFLPTEKRFRAIGRRWQWYWMLAVGSFALISSITDVDVDRYYLPELPIVLANFFWFLMLPATMAVVWESVRHWGSWQERQMVDPNPFLLRQDDKRSKVEFYLPLVFYFFFWMVSLRMLPPFHPLDEIVAADAGCLELLHGSPPLLVTNRKTTLPIANCLHRETLRNRHPLQASSLLPLLQLAHHNLFPAPFNKILQTPEPGPLQQILRLRKIHTAEIPPHAPALLGHGSICNRMLD